MNDIDRYFQAEKQLSTQWLELHRQQHDTAVTGENVLAAALANTDITDQSAEQLASIDHKKTAIERGIETARQKRYSSIVEYHKQRGLEFRTQADSIMVDLEKRQKHVEKLVRELSAYEKAQYHIQRISGDPSITETMQTEINRLRNLATHTANEKPTTHGAIHGETPAQIIEQLNRDPLTIGPLVSVVMVWLENSQTRVNTEIEKAKSKDWRMMDARFRIALVWKDGKLDPLNSRFSFEPIYHAMPDPHATFTHLPSDLARMKRASIPNMAPIE